MERPREDAGAEDWKNYYIQMKLGDLKAIFEENGQVFEVGWGAKVYLKSGTNRLSDTWFFTPEGKKLRMKKVREAFGLGLAGSSDNDSAAVATTETADPLQTRSVSHTTTNSDGEQQGEEQEFSGDEEGDGEEAAAPVVQLAEVPVVTGEEGEQTLFDEHAKLYRFGADKVWRLRGEGWAFIKLRERSTYRFLFREDETLVLRANHRIIPGISVIIPHNEPSTVRWCCPDFADGEEVDTTFALRFDCPELSRRFLRIYEAAIDATKFSAVEEPNDLPDDNPTVSELRLHVLDLEELKRLCYTVGIVPRSDKRAAIKSLATSELKYDELANMSQMKCMLRVEGLATGGCRSDLVGRLIETHKAGMLGTEEEHYEKYGAKEKGEDHVRRHRAYDQMLAAVEMNAGHELSTNEYRKIMSSHGLLELDHDVCHIIARSNGGANHPDNYFLLGGRCNRRLGKYGDHVMTYLVGLKKAQKAVAVSRRQGNTTYGRYRGRSAELLFEEGGRAISRAMQDAAMEREPLGLYR